MFLRISFCFEDDDNIKTIEVNIEHFSCWLGDENVLSLYDHDLAVYDIPLKYIYTFSYVDPLDSGIGFTVFNDLDLAFESIGLKEVKSYKI